MILNIYLLVYNTNYKAVVVVNRGSLQSGDVLQIHEGGNLFVIALINTEASVAHNKLCLRPSVITLISR